VYVKNSQLPKGRLVRRKHCHPPLFFFFSENLDGSKAYLRSAEVFYLLFFFFWNGENLFVSRPPNASFRSLLLRCDAESLIWGDIGTPKDQPLADSSVPQGVP